MKNLFLRWAAALGSLVFVCLLTFGQVPQLLNYQGRVAVSGVPFNGTGHFKFALVDANGGTTYWSHDGSSSAGSQPATSVSLAVSKGLYAVALGDSALPNMTAVPPTVFLNSDVRLRVWFNDGTRGFEYLSPDTRITAVGYAMMANTLPPNPTLTGTVTATAFRGDGSQLTGISGGGGGSPTPPPGMVLIPGGTFTMGNTIPADADIPDATPVTVNVSPFYMGINEVSWSEWRSVYLWATLHGYSLGSQASGKAPNYPVGIVNWYDVVKWCNARSERNGKRPVYYTDAGFTSVYRTGGDPVFANWASAGYRLPTEAEWEKAARGGLSGQRFPWGDQIDQNLANYFSDGSVAYDLGPFFFNPTWGVGSSPYTNPGGSFAANTYGLNDMAGSVFEWCWDWYGTPYAGGTDPRGPATGTIRVRRGGAWADSGRRCRVADRSWDNPATLSDSLGFRVVLIPGP